MDIIQEIKNFVEDECKKESSKYGYEPYSHHFIPMVRYAEQLADELGGDKEIIILAAWLHDIGAIVHGRENHHLTGADIAGQKLKEFDYPDEKIQLVKRCISNHRGSLKNKCETLEEKIISEADAMANFSNLPGIFAAAYLFENKNQTEARLMARQKLENKWNQLMFEKSKEIIRPKYEAAMLLLE